MLARPLCAFLSFCCCFWCLAARLCPTLCDPLDCNLPGSSVHGLAQARILEWDLPAPRFELASPALQADSLSLSHLGSPCLIFQSLPVGWTDKTFSSCIVSLTFSSYLWRKETYYNMSFKMSENWMKGGEDKCFYPRPSPGRFISLAKVSLEEMRGWGNLSDAFCITVRMTFLCSRAIVGVCGQAC